MTNQLYVNWDGQNVRLEWFAAKELASTDIVTSVHGYCFKDGKTVLVQVKNRGFNIPGGHLELGETPEEALHREVYEEAYVSGKVAYLGAIEINHKENPLFMENGKYPLISYQLFYRMDIENCFTFLREHETTTRIWVEPEEVSHVMNDHELSVLVLEEALKVQNVNDVTRIKNNFVSGEKKEKNHRSTKK